jgi:hypothetical protein
MARVRSLLALTAIAALATAWSGCGSDDNSASTTAPVPSATNTSQTGTEDHGTVTDANGAITNGSDSGSAVPPVENKGKGAQPGDDSGGHGGGRGGGAQVSPP